MVVPSLLAWIEQRHDRMVDRVQSAEVRAFVKVAAKTAKGEVFRRIIREVLLRNDVVNRKLLFVTGLREVALLAAAGGAALNQTAYRS